LHRSQQNNTFEKDYVFAVGGCVGSQAIATVERYSIKSDVWIAMPDLNIARVSAAVIVISNHLYVFGGRNEKFGYVSAVERINLKNAASKFEVIEQQLT
jgi:hypothetical protein